MSYAKQTALKKRLSKPDGKGGFRPASRKETKSFARGERQHKSMLKSLRDE